MDANYHTIKKNSLTHNCYILMLSLIIGALAGISSAIFIYLYNLFHNLFFSGKISFLYNPSEYTTLSPFGFLIIFIPVIGSIIVAFLIKNIAPDAKGSGVPQVMKAIIINKGYINPITGIIKFFTSSISLGSGGSIGIEGPISLIGATIGSIFGKIRTITYQEKTSLLAAGAGAGIATIFDTPLAGFTFAIELLIVKFNAKNIMPVAAAVTSSIYINKLFNITNPFLNIISIPTMTSATHYFDIILIIVLGVISGLWALLFIQALYFTEDFFNKLSNNYYIRHSLAMLIVGIMIFLFAKFSGQYHIEGIGHATIISILKNILSNPYFLLLLLIAKLLATCLTLGTGASGGILSPTLFMGACLGGLFAIICQKLFPFVDINNTYFILAAMSAMLAGVTGAVLTSIIMLIELTSSFNSILFLLLASSISYFIRKTFCYNNIYTKNLQRQGIIYPYSL
tara:strand:- start:292 stop:1656 length:1365 start_codon:yes stop_codon:yes gene_type:complete